MKISDVSALRQSVSGASLMEPKINSRSESFKNQLTAADGRELHERLESLTATIDAEGRNLFKRVDMTTLAKYKELVREYMNEAVRNSYDFSQEGRFDSMGRHKLFSNVRTIDKKLDDLTKEVLKGQQENLAILGLVDDIRGMLLDLYL